MPLRAQASFALLLLAAFSLAVHGAHAFEAAGEASGSLVLSFSATDVSATFSGSVSLSGVFLLRDKPIEFAAEGVLNGDGRVGLMSGEIAGWIVISAEGETNAGEVLSVHGGLIVTSGTGAGSGNALGSGSGRFDLRLSTPSFDIRARGDAEGAASGRFVIPADSLRMQLEGEAAFTLLGSIRADQEPSASAASPGDPLIGEEDPLAIDTWPEHLAKELRRALCAPAEST